MPVSVQERLPAALLLATEPCGIQKPEELSVPAFCLKWCLFADWTLILGFLDFFDLVRANPRLAIGAS